MDLANRTALVTGATNGIGLEACVAFAKQGARVVMVGRDPARTAAAVEDVKRRSGSDRVESLLCDFASQASIRALAEAYRAKYDRLDLLVNNAGAVSDKRTLTVDGIESTFAVNHLGYFLLTNLLLELVVKSAPARIVVVASDSHYRGTLDFDDLGFERGYFILRAYERSKLANVLFTRALAKRLAGTGVTVNAMNPGRVATNIWSNAPKFAIPFLRLWARLAMRTPAEGADVIVHLATSPALEGRSGEYLDGNKRIREPSKIARDDATAERLWTVSEQLTGRATSAAA